MFYIITDQGVISGKNLQTINKTHNLLIQKDELKAIGADYVVCMTQKDIDFCQDKAKLSQIMFGNFFKKDSMPTILSIVTIILCFLNLIVK